MNPFHSQHSDLLFDRAANAKVRQPAAMNVIIKAFFVRTSAHTARSRLLQSTEMFPYWSCWYISKRELYLANFTTQVDTDKLQCLWKRHFSVHVFLPFHGHSMLRQMMCQVTTFKQQFNYCRGFMKWQGTFKLATCHQAQCVPTHMRLHNTFLTALNMLVLSLRYFISFPSEL